MLFQLSLTNIRKTEFDSQKSNSAESIVTVITSVNECKWEKLSKQAAHHEVFQYILSISLNYEAFLEDGMNQIYCCPNQLKIIKIYEIIQSKISLIKKG